MWTRKLQGSNQTTWAKPTTSVINLARRRSIRTPRNTQAVNLGIRVMVAVAAAANPRKRFALPQKFGSNSFLFFSLSLS
jgi:hypothetical protein